MLFILIFAAAVIVCCVLLNDMSNKVGVPVLLAFLLLGIATQSSGLIHIDFRNLQSAETVATVALIFIMFYGGFGTRWKSAKPVVCEAGLLASLGVVITAALTGMFCHFVLGWMWIESLLMGSVISSTDAASVFSILRSRKLGLKNNSAPLLELESGSNDPVSNILTIIFISILKGDVSTGSVIWMFAAQLLFGAGLGLVIAQLAILAMNKIKFTTSGFDSLFVLAIALLAYAVPSAIGGNGYLSVYIVGIIMGNHEFSHKKQLVGFFDGITGLMQVVIFYMLGFLARPSEMHKVLLPSLAIFAFLLLISRPATVYALLKPFRKYSLKQIGLVSFVGLRGAASVVFAIMATVDAPVLSHDILNVVFCIVLLSISLQGFFIPIVAKKLDMIDSDSDVMQNFTDFSESNDVHFSEFTIDETSSWSGKCVKELGLPKSMLLCSITSPDGTSYIPKGDTVFHSGDKVILCSHSVKGVEHMFVSQVHITSGNRFVGCELRYYPAQRNQVLLIKRGDQNIIPHGSTVLMKDDVLYINNI